MPQALELNNEGFIVRGVPNASQGKIDVDPLLVPGPAQGGFYHPRWDFTNEQWTEGDPDAPAKRLEKTVTAKKREMKQAMASVLDVGFTCSNSIKMDAYQKDGSSLDQGVRLAQKAGATDMVVRDYNNVRHTVPVTEADQMVLEVGNNWLTQWQRKNDREEEVDALVARTKLTADDPDYLTVDQAITEVEAVAW